MNAALDFLHFNKDICRDIFACDAVMNVCNFYMDVIVSFDEIVWTNINLNFTNNDLSYARIKKNIEFIELFEKSLISINNFSEHGFDEKKAEPVFKFLMKQTNNLSIVLIRELENKHIISESFVNNTLHFLLKYNNFKFENVKILNGIENIIKLSNINKNNSILIVSLKLYFRIYENFLIEKLILHENENLCTILFNILNSKVTTTKIYNNIILYCLKLIMLLITTNKTNRYYFENFSFFELLIKFLNIFQNENIKIENQIFEMVSIFTSSKSNGYLDLGDVNSDIFGSLDIHLNLLKSIPKIFYVEKPVNFFYIIDNLTRQCIGNCIKFLSKYEEMTIYILASFYMVSLSDIDRVLKVLQNLALKIKIINNSELILNFFDEKMFKAFKNLLEKFGITSISLTNKILTILNIFVENFDDTAKYLEKIQIRLTVFRLYTTFVAASVPVKTTITTINTRMSPHEIRETTILTALREELNNKFLVFLSNNKLQYNNNNEPQSFLNFQWRDDEDEVDNNGVDNYEINGSDLENETDDESDNGNDNDDNNNYNNNDNSNISYVGW
jgi:hypothetical protein